MKKRCESKINDNMTAQISINQIDNIHVSPQLYHDAKN